MVHGKTNGVFQTWQEVIDSIKEVKNPLFKGFNDFCEALDQLLLLLGKTDKGKRPQTTEQSSPSLSKMDEKGVHSPLNATRPTVSGIGIASPVQTATGKDISSPLMAVTLPKSEEEPDTPPGLKLRRKRKVAIKKKTIEDILRISA